ncbi:MAG: SRPBCC domain-containing protein [Bacteroidia bacterium]
MAPLKFSIKINAPKEKVWTTLWNDTTYRQWTAPFTPGSHAVSDWNEGSKIKFMDAKGSGMHSIIDKKIINRQMTFKHMGEIKNGVEELKDLENALESYFLSEENGITQLDVELAMDANEEFQIYFEEVFPKALALVKQISEN